MQQKGILCLCDVYWPTMGNGIGVWGGMGEAVMSGVLDYVENLSTVPVCG